VKVDRTCRSRAYLEAKAEGDKRMPLKRDMHGGAQCWVSRDLRHMVKAGLLEPQSPAMQVAHPPLTAPIAEPPGYPDKSRRRDQPSSWWAVRNDLTQGDDQGTYVTLETFIHRETRDRLRGASPMATELP
jgi:hypothetical protein